VSEKRNGGGKQSFPPPFMSGMIEVDPPPSRSNQLLRQLVKRARARTRPPPPRPASPRPLCPLYNACGDAAADCCVVVRALAIRAKDGALPGAKRGRGGGGGAGGLEYISYCCLRLNGRRGRVCKIRCFCEALSRADGSAYYEQGNTRILGAMYGPREPPVRARAPQDHDVVFAEISAAAFCWRWLSSTALPVAISEPLRL
jgi:hypothetical protein